MEHVHPSTIPCPAGFWDALNWWLCGGEQPYLAGAACMQGDPWVIGARVIENTLVLLTYLGIALLWRRQMLRFERHTPEFRALHKLFWIFVWCGICGYGTQIGSIFWPGWRFYILPPILLIVYAGIYLFRGRGLTVVYDTFHRGAQAERELRHKQAQVANLVAIVNELTAGSEEKRTAVLDRVARSKSLTQALQIPPSS